jgi:ABC-type branched-subunit amino acid transport system substrate-binding protein
LTGAAFVATPIGAPPDAAAAPPAARNQKNHPGRTRVHASPRPATPRPAAGRRGRRPSCRRAAGPGAAGGGEPIRIGAVLSVTGPASFLGDPEDKTLRLYVNRINAAGG